MNQGRYKDIGGTIESLTHVDPIASKQRPRVGPKYFMIVYLQCFATNRPSNWEQQGTGGWPISLITELR